jgi:hypothetical protein
MRTKALLGLAALAAGALTASAQNNVYSLNVVGYYNVTMKPGYNLVANQLNTGTNGLGQVIPGAPIESQVLKFVGGTYVVDISDGTAWLDANSGNPSTTVVKPGEGFFFYNPKTTDLPVTFVGEVTQGNNLTVAIPAGYALVSSIVPQAIDLTAANGFNPLLEMQYLTFNSGTQNYNVPLINDGTQWLDSNTGNPMTATAQVGQGFFIYNPDTANHNWVRNFTVQ